MKFIVEEKEKKAFFISVIQQLKVFTKTLCLFFNDDYLYIQGMDTSHVCLYEAKLVDTWFHFYQKSETDHGMICLNPTTLALILSMAEDGYSIVFEYENEPSELDIHICKIENKVEGVKSTNYDKHFSLPLIDYEAELLAIPECEYDIQFSLPAKKICEIVSQLAIFGDELKMNITEEIVLSTSGDLGEMKVNISYDDLTEFIMNEGGEYTAAFGLQYVHKYCLTSKLLNEIHFSLSKDFPMRIQYKLDDNYIMFFIAPKIDD